MVEEVWSFFRVRAVIFIYSFVFDCVFVYMCELFLSILSHVSMWVIISVCVSIYLIYRRAQLMKNYENTLILRVRMPISDDLSPRNFITKACSQPHL